MEKSWIRFVKNQRCNSTGALGIYKLDIHKKKERFYFLARDSTTASRVEVSARCAVLSSSR